MKVLFATKTWKGDLHKFLSGAFARKFKSCKYDFDEKWLMINNGVPNDAINKLRKMSGADKVIEVIPKAEEVLDFFNLRISDFDGGYWYSISELTEIYLAKDFDYLCHMSSDALIEPASDWITKGLEILKNDKNISVVSPGSDVNTWGEIDQFFSDQGYLISVDEFRKRIYNYKEPELPEFPAHGGNSFERLCAKYLVNEGKGRRVLYEHALQHEAW